MKSYIHGPALFGWLANGSAASVEITLGDYLLLLVYTDMLTLVSPGTS